MEVHVVHALEASGEDGSPTSVATFATTDLNYARELAALCEHHGFDYELETHAVDSRRARDAFLKIVR